MPVNGRFRCNGVAPPAEVWSEAKRLEAGFLEILARAFRDGLHDADYRVLLQGNLAGRALLVEAAATRARQDEDAGGPA